MNGTDMRCTLLVLVLLCATSVGCTGQEQAKVEKSDLGTKLVELLRQRRYEDALAAARREVRGDSHDAQIYSWLALIHVTRAHNEPAKREQDLDAAAEYARRSVAVAADDKNLMRYDASSVLETAGDIGTSKRCSYYGEAEDLLRSLLQGADERIKRAASTGIIRITEKVARSKCER